MPKDPDTCAYKHCRKPADGYARADSKSLARRDQETRGYCSIHEGLRLEQALKAWRASHAAEISAPRAEPPAAPQERPRSWF